MNDAAMADRKLSDVELTQLESEPFPLATKAQDRLKRAVAEIREHRATVRKLHAQVDQTDPDDAVGVALTRAGCARGEYGPDDVVALRARVPSRRMIELLERIASQSGSVAHALSASEWHELQEEASPFSEAS